MKEVGRVGEVAIRDKNVLHFHFSRKNERGRHRYTCWAEKQGHRDSDQGADLNYGKRNQKEEIIMSHMVS